MKMREQEREPTSRNTKMIKRYNTMENKMNEEMKADREGLLSIKNDHPVFYTSIRRMYAELIRLEEQLKQEKKRREGAEKILCQLKYFINWKMVNVIGQVSDFNTKTFFKLTMNHLEQYKND